MLTLRAALLMFALSCAVADAAALVPVPTPQVPLPVTGLEINQGQASAGILFLIPGVYGSMAVTPQSVLYSPLGAALSLVASNSNPAVSFSDPLPGSVNYYTGADPMKWITGIPRYAAANLAAVYPGINVQYTIGSNGVLTLNLLLAAGVDPKTITFQIAPSSQITVNPDGSLTATLAQGFGFQFPSTTLSYPLAVASQGQQSRSVSYAVQSTTRFGLEVQGMDTTLPLQISIQLNAPSSGLVPAAGLHSLWAFGAASDIFTAIAVADAARLPGSGAGDCVVGAGTNQAYACTDVAIYKYSAAGIPAFITYLSGLSNDNPAFLALAPDGAIVVAGGTGSPGFPVTAGALQTTFMGTGGDLFAARIDSATGQLLTSTFFAGPNGATTDTVLGGLGSDGSLYFLPTGFAAGMPVTSGAVQPTCQGNPCSNAYVARLGPALDSLIYGTYLPGNSGVAAQLNSDGSIYYGGQAGPGFPTTPGAYQSQSTGSEAGFIARLDPSGSKLLFATYSGPNPIVNLAVAPDDSVWAVSTSFVLCCTIQYDLIHLDAKGAQLLAHPPLAAYQMAVDKAGNLFALGPTGFTPTADALLSDSCGGIAYVELSPSGQQLFATYLPPNIGGLDGADAQGTPYLDTLSKGAPNGRIQIVQTQTVGPFVGCIVDAATFGNEETTSPGAIVTIFGSGLGPNPGVGFQVVNGQVPTSLSSTQVLVNGEPAPLLYASDKQLNLIVPYSLQVGTAPSIQAVSNDTPANQISALVVDQGITIFQVNGQAAALNQDGTLNSPQNPAKPGSVVMLFGTGGGQTIPPSVAGEITPFVLRPLAKTPQIAILPGPILTVEWAGAAPGLVSGVTQINVRLPDTIPFNPDTPPGTAVLYFVNLDTSDFQGYVTISVASN